MSIEEKIKALIVIVKLIIQISNGLDQETTYYLLSLIEKIEE